MPTFVWILIWVAVLATVAALVVRERRSGRRGPSEVDPLQNSAVREASVRRDARGPNTFGGS